ncbi:uncharacterized protein LOC119725578 [Patiria miniata]|uniref:Uncharacterized protein n=1 Tax=Patiria miniata TaxID=46514 RepID=A0A913ZMJ5_PATMI|nr:uncharacterized protein LOC119725578 [Patiria miniata]
MSASETTERKGKFFKAIVTTPPDLSKPKNKATARPSALPTLQPRKYRPVDRAPGTSAKTAPGPTGEATASVPGGDANETPNIIGRLEEATSGVKCEETGRCGDDVRNLTKLLFNRNVSGFLNESNKLEDIAIIQTIFNANHVPQTDAIDTRSHVSSHQQKMASKTEVDLPCPSTQPGLRSTVQSEPNQLNQGTNIGTSRTYRPLLVRGKQGGVLRLATSDAKDEPPPPPSDGNNQPKQTDKRFVGKQRTVGAYPMRLPKLSVQQRELGNKSCSGKETGNQDSDKVCCGTTNIKRSRGRQQMSKSTGSTEAGTSIFYPSSSNVTIIRRRGRHAKPRAGSPMPSPRKPLPPIRRRHHSDICTVCPEVHDWKGLARNPRWYPSAKSGSERGTTCSCEKGSTDAPSTECDQDCRADTASEERVEAGEGQTLKREDEEESTDEQMKDAQESNWFPEKSIAVPNSEDSDNDEESKTTCDKTCNVEMSKGSDDILHAHCQWLTSGNSSLSGGHKHILLVDGDGYNLPERLRMDGLDFECDNTTEIAFEDDSALLQAVLLRNHALNYGVVSESGDPNPPTEVKGQAGEMAENGNQPVGTRKYKRFDDRSGRLTYPTRLVQGSCEAVGRLCRLSNQVDRQGSQMSIIPRAEVIMTSRGQRKVVNSSLVAVGRGQSASNVQSGEEVSRGSEEVVIKDDSSSEALLKREMNRYLHSLRHENAREKRYHQSSASSAQNIPMKVQNLSAVRPITADISSTSVLASQVTKAVGFIPSVSRDEYESLCRKTAHPTARFPRAPAAALPPIAGTNPREMLLIKRFDGEVKGMQLPRQRERKN